MKLDVVIPTYMRGDKLRRTLSSVHGAIEQCGKSVEVKVKVFYSSKAEWETNSKEMNWPWVEHFILPTYADKRGFSLPVFWNDRLKESTADAMCYLTDDVLLNRFCLAIAAMEIDRMGFDGVVGFNIENITEPYQPCLAAFGVIGLKYADRFQDRQVFCPEYTSLYADIELQRQATALGRFKFHTACMLVHFHPAYVLGERDMTHTHTRRNFDNDKSTFERRSRQGLVWGLVNA